MRVAFIAYGVTWFVLINTVSGVSSIHPTQLAMSWAFRVSRRRQRFVHLRAHVARLILTSPAQQTGSEP